MKFGNGLHWRKRVIWDNSCKELSRIKRDQKQLERKNEGPGEADKENDRLLRAAQAAGRGQLRTAARLLGGSKLLPSSSSIKRVMKPRNGRMTRLRKPHTG